MDENRLWVKTLWEPLDEKSKSPLQSKEEGIKVAAYCRVSNRKNSFVSLQNQISYYTNLISSKPNWRLTGIYVDNNLSGATYDKRPGFKRMLRHAKEGRIDLILTKSVSRFARNSKELIEVVNQLKEDNVSIFFEAENIDTSLNYNSLLLHTYAAIAQDEIETASQLVRLASERKFIKGTPSFNMSMYGYDIVEHEGNRICKINEQEARVVRWIFEQFIGGKSYAQINRELISQGIETKKGNKRWGSGFVGKIITEIAYTGNKIARKRTKDLLTGKIKQTNERDQYYIMNSHPAIISEETYIMAQNIVKKSAYSKHKSHKKPSYRPFSRRITCGRCKGIFRAQYTDIWLCVNAFSSVGLCDAKKIKDKQLLQMSIRAFKERFDFKAQGTLKELLKILHKINQNDHFEFHRLRYFAEIEIASCRECHEKALELKKEYDEFEKEVSKIEDDRVFRDKALKWLEGIDSLEEFESTITLELARAWIADIEIYSEDIFIVRWIDEKETVINAEKIEDINKSLMEKQAAEPKTNSSLDEKSLESRLITKEEVDALLETQFGNQYKAISTDNINNNILKRKTMQHKADFEAIKLEHGLGIEDVRNLKKNLAKTKAASFINKNEKKLRVACYCRVSTHMEEQQVSFQTQIAYYTYLILKNPKYIYAGIFADEGESGTSLRRRDDFNRMISEAKAGKIDLIITKSLSRFGRNVVDVLETIKTLRELPNPVHCYFEKENIHTADDKAHLLVSLMSSVNENEVVGLSSSITWGIKKLAQRGIINRTTDIYGYTIDKKRNWKVVPEQAQVIRWIAKEFIAGKSIRDIAKGLRERGVKSPTGQDRWSENTIREMLKNEKYKGDYLFQKMYIPEVIGSKARKNKGEKMQYYIEKHHPAIIDENEWSRIQEILKKRSRKPIENSKALKTAGRSAFYQKFFCSECKGLVSRNKSRSQGREGSNWRCYNSYGPLIPLCQSGNSIRQEYIEFNFMKTLSQISESDEFRIKVEEVIDKLRLSQQECLHEEEIREKIEVLNQQLYQAVDGEMSREGHDTRKIDYLTGEIIKLQNELKELTEREEKAECYKAQLRELLKACKSLNTLNVRDYHNMDVRIEPGDSIYSTTKNAKDKTYIKEDSLDNFREDLFEKYVLKAHLDYDGVVEYDFVFGMNYGCGMKYQEYLEAFENAKAEINLEELLISKEVAILKHFCKQPRFPQEMREHLHISSECSFSRRILKPLIEAGRLKLIRGTQRYDWRYYWEEEINK